jgi:hypothetical protein
MRNSGARASTRLNASAAMQTWLGISRRMLERRRAQSSSHPVRLRHSSNRIGVGRSRASSSGRRGCRGVAGSGLQVDVAEIVAHEANHPRRAIGGHLTAPPSRTTWHTSRTSAEASHSSATTPVDATISQRANAATPRGPDGSCAHATWHFELTQQRAQCGIDERGRGWVVG